MAVVELGIVTCARPVQSINALSFMRTTVSGIVREVSPEHPEKAPESIKVTELVEKSIEVIPLQPK
jgi:hypothetical protein